MSKMPHNNGRSKQGQCHLLATSMIWQDAVLPQQMHSQAVTCIQQYNTSFEEVNVFKLVKACSNLLCPWGSLPKRKLLNKHCWGALTRLQVTFGKHLLFFHIYIFTINLGTVTSLDLYSSCFKCLTLFFPRAA